MSCYIIGTGAALPERVVPNSELAPLLGVTSAAPGRPGSTIGRPADESSSSGATAEGAGAVMVGADLASTEAILDTEAGLV